MTTNESRRARLVASLAELRRGRVEAREQIAEFRDLIRESEHLEARILAELGQGAPEVMGGLSKAHVRITGGTLCVGEIGRVMARHSHGIDVDVPGRSPGGVSGWVRVYVPNGYWAAL